MSLERILNQYFCLAEGNFLSEGEKKSIQYSQLTSLISELYNLTECFEEAELLETLDLIFNEERLFE